MMARVMTAISSATIRAVVGWYIRLVGSVVIRNVRRGVASYVVVVEGRALGVAGGIVAVRVRWLNVVIGTIRGASLSRHRGIVIIWVVIGIA